MEREPDSELEFTHHQIEELKAKLSDTQGCTLTTAETKVFILYAQGLSYKEIASRLKISDKTVKTHATRMHGKLFANTGRPKQNLRTHVTRIFETLKISNEAEREYLAYDLQSLTDSCAKSIENKVNTKLGGKYVPELYVPRDIETRIKDWLFKSPQKIAMEIAELESGIIRSTSPPPDASEQLIKSLKLKQESYSGVINVLKDTIAGLRNGNKVDWSRTLPRIEAEAKTLNAEDRRELLDQIREVINNVVVVIDKAGRGKTNLLCHMALDWSKTEKHLVSLLLPGQYRYTDGQSMLRQIGMDLGFLTSIDLDKEWFSSLDSKLREQNRFLVVVVDAINEDIDNKVLLPSNLQKLAALTYSHNFRLIFSCRDVSWDNFEFRLEGFEQYVASTEKVGDFSDPEFRVVWGKYCDYFHITADLSKEVADSFRASPLLLRFFCEAYGDRDQSRNTVINLGQVTHVKLKRLFDDYWEKKSTEVRKRLDHRNTWAIENFLKSLALEMLASQSRTTPINRVLELTPEKNVERPESTFVGILDEDIILESSTEEQKPSVRFVYDEFMEYMMARAVVEKLLFADTKSLVNEISSILRSANDYRTIFGMVGYLALMVKDEHNLSIWEPLLQTFPEWDIDALRSLVQVDDNEWDTSMSAAFYQGIQTLCEKVQASDFIPEFLHTIRRLSIHPATDSIPMWIALLDNGTEETLPLALDTLMRLAKTGQGDADTQLKEAMTTGASARQIAEYLKQMDDQYALDLLVQGISHPDCDVREEVASGLGYFPPTDITREALLELMEDSDWNVCFSSAVSIIRDPDEEVITVLNELSDCPPIYEYYEDLIPQRILKKLVYIHQLLHSKFGKSNLGYLVSEGDADLILEILGIFTEKFSFSEERSGTRVVLKAYELIKQIQDIYFSVFPVVAWGNYLLSQPPQKRKRPLLAPYPAERLLRHHL